MRHRLAALLGSIGHGIRAIAGSLLALVGLAHLARFAVPLLVAVLVIAALLSARDTAAILDARPEVTQATLSEVAAFEGDPDRSIWFQLDAIVDDTWLETSADFGTFFYLARDPAEPETGIIVRSTLDDAEFRQRVVGATVVEDPALVADALTAFGSLPPGIDLEDARHLDELEAGGDPDAAFRPSELDGEPVGSNVLVAGRVVSPSTYAVCATPEGCEAENARWLYLFADNDGGEAIVLRSPHPPSAIPMRLQGLFLRDTFDLAPVVGSGWFEAIDADVPTNRALAAGSSPPVTVEASWVPTIAFAALAVLLLASHFVGYPVFASGPEPTGGRSLPVGGAIDAAITGRMARDRRMLHLDRSPGAVERLSIEELALRLWRYGLLPGGQSRREAEQQFVAGAGGQPHRLVVHERDQSALVIVEPRHAGASAQAGRTYRIAGSAPAVHFRQGRSDAYLETRTEEDRDLLAAELAAELASEAGRG